MRLSHKRKVRSKKCIDQAAWEAKQKRRLRRVRPVVWIVPNRIGKTSNFWSARQEIAPILNIDVKSVAAAVHLSAELRASSYELFLDEQKTTKRDPPSFTHRLVNGFKRFFGVTA